MNTNTPFSQETPEAYIPQPDAREYRRFFSRIGLSVFVLAVSYIAASVLLEYIIYFINPDFLTQWWYTWVMSVLPLYAFGLPLMYLVLHSVPVAPKSSVQLIHGVEVPLPRFKGGWWFVIAVIGMGYMYIGSLIGNGLMSALSSLVGYDYRNPLESTVMNSPMWINFICTVIVAPLGEELIFRKLLMDRVRRYGDTSAILLSSFFFAIFHGNLFQFFYAFGLGLLLGYLYARTGQMRWNVALHAFVNFMGGFFVQLLTSRLDLEALASGSMTALMEQFSAHPLAMAVYLLYSMLIYGLILAAVVLTICFVAGKKIRLGRGVTTLTRGRSVLMSVFNVGILLAVAICLLLMVLNLIPPRGV